MFRNKLLNSDDLRRSLTEHMNVIPVEPKQLLNAKKSCDCCQITEKWPLSEVIYSVWWWHDCIALISKVWWEMGGLSLPPHTPVYSADESNTSVVTWMLNGSGVLIVAAQRALKCFCPAHWTLILAELLRTLLMDDNKFDLSAGRFHNITGFALSLRYCERVPRIYLHLLSVTHFSVQFPENDYFIIYLSILWHRITHCGCSKKKQNTFPEEKQLFSTNPTFFPPMVHLAKSEFHHSIHLKKLKWPTL